MPTKLSGYDASVLTFIERFPNSAEIERLVSNMTDNGKRVATEMRQSILEKTDVRAS